MKISTKKIVSLALLCAMGLIMFMIESLFPPLFLPGAKMGLSNIFSLLTLVIFGPWEALIVVLVRTILGSMFTGSMATLLYSLTAGVVSVVVSSLLFETAYPKVSLLSISIVSAVVHNLTQNIVFCTVSNTPEMYGYAPWLAVLGVVAGCIVGLTVHMVVKSLPYKLLCNLVLDDGAGKGGNQPQTENVVEETNDVATQLTETNDETNKEGNEMQLNRQHHGVQPVDENTLKNIAVITDISAVGRCSGTVALPILSVLKQNCMLVATSMLSAQTGFDKFTILANNKLEQFLDDVNVNSRVDYVVVGFLADCNQVSDIAAFIHATNAKVIYDPIMGDNGELYCIYDNDYVTAVRTNIVGSALALPNLTEACLLLGVDYNSLVSHSHEENYLTLVRDTLGDICSKLQVGSVCVTGIVTEKLIANMVIDGGKTSFVTAERLGGSYSGTGDIFSSVIAGCLAKGQTLVEAVTVACKFVCRALKVTDENQPTRYGVNFQLVLNTLAE